jgi:hypothetical protein
MIWRVGSTLYFQPAILHSPPPTCSRVISKSRLHSSLVAFMWLAKALLLL